MSDDLSNNSGSTDLQHILDYVKQITQDFESLTVQLRRDKATIATLIARSPRTSDRNPMQPAIITSSVALQRVDQSVAKQNALGGQLLRDTATFAEALMEWTTELEKRGHLTMPERSPPPATSGHKYTSEYEIDAQDKSAAETRVKSNIEGLIGLKDNDAAVKLWSAKTGIDPNLIRAIIIQESSNPINNADPLGLATIDVQLFQPENALACP